MNAPALSLFSKLRCVFLGSAAAILFSMPVSAAPITWGTVSGIGVSGDSDINTAGTFITAYNIGGATTTVNGVVFVGTGGSTSAAGISNIGFPGSAFTSGATPIGSPFDLLSGNYQSLVGTGGYVAYPSGTFTLSGLTTGNTYSFQIWANDSRGTNDPDFQADIASRTSIFSGVTDVALLQNTGGPGSDNYAGGLGQMVTGTFVADASTQSIGTTPYALLNAYQVRDITAIPEPTSAVLVGVGALGFAVCRRRARSCVN